MPEVDRGLTLIDLVPDQPEALRLETEMMILNQHAKLAKALKDLGFIAKLSGPDKDGFYISTGISKRRIPQDWPLELEVDSKKPQASFPWPFNQPDATLWAERTGRIGIGWKEGDLSVEVSIYPHGGNEHRPGIEVDKYTRRGVVQMYSEGMELFSYRDGKVSRTTFTPKIWNKNDIEAQDKGSRRTDAPKRLKNLLYKSKSPIPEHKKHVAIRQVVERDGIFTEAISSIAYEQATREDVEAYSAWKNILKITDSLSEAAQRNSDSSLVSRLRKKISPRN